MNRSWLAFRIALPSAYLLLFGCCHSAPAQDYSVGYNINGQVYIGDGSGDADNPIDTIPFNPVTKRQTSITSPPLTAAVSASGGTASVIGHGTAALGTLHTFSNFTATGTGGGTIVSSVFFHDILTVTSATLPIDTPVLLQPTLTADDTVTLGNLYSNSFIDGYLDVDTYNFNQRGSSLGSLTFSDYDIPGTYSHDLRGTIQAKVGEQLYFYGSLGAETSSHGTDYAGATSATADAGNTAHFYIDSLTPGVSFTTASGQSYLSPTAVPEASTAALLGLPLVLGGVAAAARRKKKRQAA